MSEPIPPTVLRKSLLVSGMVQGVGFRPFVYRLAQDCALTGSVANTAAGVSIEIQGDTAALDTFVQRLKSELPPLARITQLSAADIALVEEAGFRIASTLGGASARTLISPDVALCEDCLHEMRDPRDRRFRYPFINCTNCGPRFTIVREIPYDRERTSMAEFRMCAACQKEYDDPSSRRFHAQPNACWDCGPQLQFLNADGSIRDSREPLRDCIASLGHGRIAAIKGLGGFHLACDARNPAAVNLLRERKRRVEKPFAVMVPSLEAAERLCVLDDAARRLLLSPARPIVLLPWRPNSGLPDSIAPRNHFLGLFLPYTPLHHLLFANGHFAALVMTSANLSEEPIVIDNQEALRRLDGIADIFLVHNRAILRRCDDSVVRPAHVGHQILRRSRGYVPRPVFLEEDFDPILAVGGELKNTVCVVRGNEAFLGQHVGDLENLESFDFFEESVAHLQHILETHPKVIAYDLHPDYFSTKWALEQKEVQHIAVQHHHAHIASCMAENHLDGRVIGLALDGTGYGTDGAVWGGEALLADYEGFDRAAHLQYVPLPGGSAAIHEPWRIAVSFLALHYGPDLASLSVPFITRLDPHKSATVLQMIARGVNSPMTSSCGRLFDAVSALIGLRTEINYEAQAAVELEMAASSSTDEGAYPFDLLPQLGGWQIGTRSLFAWLLDDIRKGARVEDMARRFHRGLAIILVELCERLRERHGLGRVCLSGGCFQNALLFGFVSSALKEKEFAVYSHSEVPAGDGGLSLGQAVIAAHRLRRARTPAP